MIAPPPQFEARKLCRFFGEGRRGETRAVDNATLTISRGEIAVLSGPSGSGKTTLLSLLGMLDRPTSGRLLFQDRDLTDCSDIALARARRQIGFVFQDAALLPRLSLIDNIGYPLIPRGLSPTERKQVALRWLDRLGIARYAAKSPRELSGGERQRVALARALAGDPVAVLADEPTSNLDPRTSGDVFELFRELNAGGVTLIVSTHDPALMNIASQSLVLNEGKLTSNAL